MSNSSRKLMKDGLPLLNFTNLKLELPNQTNIVTTLVPKMMDSKQSSKRSVHEMVPLGTSKEALIHELTSKTEQPLADPNIVPVKCSVTSTRKTIVLLVILVIVVAIVTVFVGIFVSKHIKNKDKEGNQRK